MNKYANSILHLIRDLLTVSSMDCLLPVYMFLFLKEYLINTLPIAVGFLSLVLYIPRFFAYFDHAVTLPRVSVFS